MEGVSIIPAHGHKLYLHDWDDSLYCVLDFVDYTWALQWRWSITKDRWGRKNYATRNTRLEGRQGRQVTLFLHKEILHRSGKPQLSLLHTIGDHLDGNSLHNARSNLDWATTKGNAATSRRWKP